jgi:hypothetical protein
MLAWKTGGEDGIGGCGCGGKCVTMSKVSVREWGRVVGGVQMVFSARC